MALKQITNGMSGAEAAQAIYDNDVENSPINSVAAGQTKAPTSDAVFRHTDTEINEAAKNILDLNVDAFTELQYFPADKSDLTFVTNETNGGIYFEKLNHHGFSKFFVKANSAGPATIHILTLSGTTATSLATKSVELAVGVNEFTPAALGFSESVLATPTFYLGVRPSAAGQTRFNYGPGGLLSVVNVSNMAVTDTTNIGSTWFASETIGDFELSDYPEIRERLNQTIQMETPLVPQVVPDDRNGINMTVRGSALAVYSEEPIFVSKTRPLQKLSIFARGAGDVFVYLAHINGASAEVAYITQITCAVGLNEFTVDQLGARSIIENSNVNLHVFCGNAQDQTLNPIHGQGGLIPEARPWYNIMRSTGAFNVGNSTQIFSFWITRYVADNPLVTEVRRLAEIVDQDTPSTKQWYQAAGVSFGDSITWYDGRQFNTSHIESGQTVRGYQQYIREYFECTIDNRGASGQDMTQILGIVTSYANFGNMDFATLTSGANDARKNIPLGSIGEIGGTFNTSTYFGAMQAAIEHMITANPLMKIYLIAPINGWFNESGTSNVPGPYKGEMFISRDYIDAVLALGRLYAIPVCNWYDNSFINKKNWRTYIGDRVEIPYYLHPTQAGYKLMGQLISRFMENN